MTFEKIRNSRPWKLVAEIHLIQWMVFAVLIPLLGAIGVWNLPNEPLEIRGLYAILAAVLLFGIVLTVVIKWEKARDQKSKRPRQKPAVGRLVLNFVKGRLGIIALTCCSVYGVLWVVSFAFYPHLKLSTPDRGHRFHIATVREKPKPNTSVIFESLRVTNNGSPSVATNWKLTATVPAGDSLTGLPLDYRGSVVTNPNSPSDILEKFPLSELLFSRTEHNPLLRGASEEGPAVFYFPGVSEEVILAPGTTLIISCEDSTGRRVKLEKRVPAQELVIPK